MTSLKEILENDEKLTQIAKVAFDSTDTDGSGQIDKQELAVAMRQISEDIGISAPTKEEVHEVFVALDIDESGKVDFLEFKEFVKNILKTLNSE